MQEREQTNHGPERDVARRTFPLQLTGWMPRVNIQIDAIQSEDNQATTDETSILHTSHEE